MSDTDEHMDQSNGHLNHDSALPLDDSEEDISLIDILLIVVRNKRMILMCAGAFAVLGVLVALLSAREYTSSAKLIREAESEASAQSFGGGNLSFLRGMGLNVGGSSAGLTPDAYPDIVKSREVRLAVVRDTFYFPDQGREMTYVEYTNRPPGFGELLVDYTIRLPWTIKDKLSGGSSSGSTPTNGLYPTEEEENALVEISKTLGTSLDVDTGLMTISTSSSYPTLSAAITQSFVDHLVERVREIRTHKSRRNLEFIEDQFAQAAIALQQAEDDLARFQDRNNSIQRARLMVEKDRLERQVMFKSDLYSSLQAQLTQAQVNLQRSEPIITLLERPVPPMEPGGSSRSVMVIYFLILGGIIGVGMAFAKTFLQKRSGQEQERLKLEEIQRSLPVQKIVQRFLPGPKVNK
ncbi:MAG: hypothetical protein KTR29_09340 [Rhodothermaceae bacterium]|nr:hypothetical protein [Rhodothermaceae bacterium]